LLALLLLLATVLLLDRLFPPDLSRVQTSDVVADASGEMLRPFLTPDGMWRMAASRETVDPTYLDMLLAYEDQRFAWHPGVDPLSLLRAVGQLVVNGRVVSGASTLTMQVARLLEPRPRTVTAKLIEMARALQLEARLGKKQILNLYLTLAPFGGNVEGVRAASLAWFGKEPRQLSPAQAALLVVLPQRPSELRPDRHALAAKAARDKVLERMAGLGVLPAEKAAEALNDPIPLQRRPFPQLAPHLAERLRQPGELRSAVQAKLQRRLERFLSTLALDQDSSVAVLVVDNASRNVRAYVGALDYLDGKRFGAVDLVRAVRSPGSTLKPMAYAMAFDAGILHPETVLLDAPTSFGGYSPTNFSEAFAGDVTAREALQMSLNVPAVAVLDRVGPIRFAARLRDAGVTLRLPKESDVPGLPVILGGAGVTLEELATLYTALANKGVAGPLRLRPDDPSPGRRVLGEAAVWQVEDILANAPPPPERSGAQGRVDRRRIAFKTGTSYGFRDAWAVGWDSLHTVAVWVGRPDGTPSPTRYGRNSAAPLLFDVFGLLPAPPPQVAHSAPPAGVTLAAPPALARWQRPDGPSIVFPPDGAVLDLASARDGLQLVAKGGVGGLAWLVNGQPLETDAWQSRQTWWTPDGPGASRITVKDAEGRFATVEVWLR
jgi:penicillin-binding protein 1C